VPAASAVDLHAHTTASDGALTPPRLVALAVARGLRVLGVTDHDTVAGVEEAGGAAAGTGLRVIPGVELSAHVEAGEVHVLGYFVAPRSPVLLDALARLRAARGDRARQMVAQLARAGAPVTYEQVLAIAGDGAIGRPHVARALVQAGHAATIDDAFERYLVRGRPGYVERYRLSPAEAAQLVRSAGGAPVLAHPHTVADLPALLPELVAAGLAGLECYYGDYDEPTTRDLLAEAARYGLVPTGGTDFHGLGTSHGRDLGATPVPYECVAQLEARRG
jgi:predicted metal-dependent phosphoesterase TrpH